MAWRGTRSFKGLQLIPPSPPLSSSLCLPPSSIARAPLLLSSGVLPVRPSVAADGFREEEAAQLKSG